MELLSINEAAKIRNVTRQAIYLAIKEGRLKAFMRGKTMKVSLASIMDLENSKYLRVAKVFKGARVFSAKMGLISVPDAAKLTGIPVISLYNSIYSGRLPAERKGVSWVVHVKDLYPVQKRYLNNKKTVNSIEEIEKGLNEIKDLSK